MSLPVVNPLSYPVQTSLSLYLNEVDISILYHFLWPCIEGHILFLLHSIHQRTYKGSTRFKRREHKFHLFTEKWQGQEEHVLLKLFLQSFLKCELAQFLLSASMQNTLSPNPLKSCPVTSFALAERSKELVL